ncbi:unnamed protein product [Closterium sp. Yama58-4]|nr:unnamed protein product [Closterium sp. Yama58-4]
MAMQQRSGFSQRVVMAVVVLLAASFVTSSRANPLTTFVVGGNYNFPTFRPNPWNLRAHTYNPQRVLPGNDLEFRWNGWRSDVWKFPTMAAYQACDYTFATQLAKPSYFGKYIYTIRQVEAGTTLYFGSRVWQNCRKGQKAKIRVNDINPLN